MRKWRVGKTGFDEVYRAVREYRERYPEKAVTYFSQQYPENGWAVLMGGGSLANIPVRAEAGVLQRALLADIITMRPLDGNGPPSSVSRRKATSSTVRGGKASLPILSGRYTILCIHPKTGEISLMQKNEVRRHVHY